MNCRQQRSNIFSHCNTLQPVNPASTRICRTPMTRTGGGGGKGRGRDERGGGGRRRGGLRGGEEVSLSQIIWVTKHRRKTGEAAFEMSSRLAKSTSNTIRLKQRARSMSGQMSRCSVFTIWTLGSIKWAGKRSTLPKVLRYA